MKKIIMLASLVASSLTVSVHAMEVNLPNLTEQEMAEVKRIAQNIQNDQQNKQAIEDDKQDCELTLTDVIGFLELIEKSGVTTKALESRYPSLKDVISKVKEVKKTIDEDNKKRRQRLQSMSELEKNSAGWKDPYWFL